MATLEALAATTRIVEQIKLIRASRARLFEAWTNPEILKQWFGPENRYCSTAKLDARVGGSYTIGVRLKDTPDAAEAIATGRYIRVEQDRLLHFNWIPSWNPGEESLVTVMFEHVTGGTEVTIRHENFPPAAFAGYTEGWHGCLNKLARTVERR
jgi:uncharacterized protein YndB with AHSA1/START domain